MFETLCELKAHKLSSIRIWKASIGDEGVRNICKYASQVGRLEILDLLDNGVTMLGCEFIAKMLPMTALKQLKLDDNLMGTTGLRELSLALRQDSHLDKLSLKYCGIDNNGAKYLV